MDQPKQHEDGDSTLYEATSESLSQFVQQYNACAVRVKNLLDKFNPEDLKDLSKAQRWLGTVHTEQERGAVLAQYISDALQGLAQELRSQPPGSQLKVFMDKIKKDVSVIERGFQECNPRILTIERQFEAELDYQTDDLETSAEDTMRRVQDSARAMANSLTGVGGETRQGHPYEEIAVQDDELGGASYIEGHTVTQTVQGVASQHSNSEIMQLARDVEEVSELFTDLSSQVNTHQPALDSIENNVTQARARTKNARKELQKASKLKSFGLPILGATVGALVFGPAGAFAGVKGGLALGACASVGAGVGGVTASTLGRRLKRRTDEVGEQEDADDGSTEVPGAFPARASRPDWDKDK